jgi:uncharacterized membrane protein
VLPETHLPTILRREARKRVYSAQRPSGLDTVAQRVVLSEVWRSLARATRLPAKIAFSHLPCFLILLLICLINGLVNMILSSLGSVYQVVYHFPTATAGLVYLGMGFGGLTALAVAKQMAAMIARKLGGAGGVEQPQNALPILFIVGPVGSVGLVWYGWSIQQRVHWIISIIGLFFLRICVYECESKST